MDIPIRPPDRETPVPEHRDPRRSVAITVSLRSLWTVALIGLVVLMATFVVIRAHGTLVLFLLSIVLAEGIRPLVARLQRYHVPIPLGVLLVYLVILLVVGVLLWLLLRPLLGEVGAFTSKLPQYLIQVRQEVHRLARSLRATGSVSSALDGLSSSLATLLHNSIPMLLTVPFTLLSGLFALFINLVVVLTMALFWLTGSARLKAFVVGLFPAQAQERASLVIGEMGQSFGGYVRGLLLSMVLIGLISGLGLTVLGVPYALLLGILAGLTALLPFIGPWISGPLAVVVTLLTVDPGRALAVIVLFFLIFVIEGELVQPLVMSRAVRVDPLLVLVSVLIGLSLLGPIGAILAVPLAASVKVLLVRVLAPAVRRASHRSASSGQTQQVAAAIAFPAVAGAPESPQLVDR